MFSLLTNTRNLQTIISDGFLIIFIICKKYTKRVEISFSSRESEIVINNKI